MGTEVQAKSTPTVAPAISHAPANLLQRKCACGGEHGVSGECEGCRNKRLGVVQRLAVNTSQVLSVPPIVHEVLRSPGQPLDMESRAFMEPRFGHDFSHVRIHTHGSAAESAKAVNALAYTVGRDIVFGTGQYAPTTNAGRRLLAHELTHTVQQANGAAGFQQQLIIGAVDTPAEVEAEGVAENIGTERPVFLPKAGQILFGTISRQTSSGTTTTTPAPVTAPTTPSTSTGTCSTLDITDNVSEALNWLDDIYQQLLDFEVDDVFSTAGTPPTTDHQRIAGALQQAFNTTDISYVGVIRRRFLHIANMLREPGRLTITCGGTFCSAGGTSITAAYVERPYALTLCNPGTPGNRPTATFIHEVGHAVVPQIGIRNTLTTSGEGIRDRAYTDERVFHHLSPEETLDNAESYGLLAELLHSRVNRQVVATQQDTTPGCTDPQPVLHAFARAEQWNRYAHAQLDAWLNFLGSNTLNTLPTEDLALIQASFPSMTTTTELRNLFNAYDSLVSHGFAVSSWELGCATAGARCPSGRLGYTYAGAVTANSVSLSTIRALLPINLCPDWLTASFDDQIRSIYTLFIIGRPGWIVSGFQLANAYNYVDFALAIVNSRAPSPTTAHAYEHDFQDRPTAPLPARPGTSATP